MSIGPARILDSLSSALVAIDAENRVCFMNVEFARHFGVEPEAFAGRPVADLIEVIRPHFADPAAAAAVGFPSEDCDASSSREVESRREGQINYLREDRVPIWDEAGQVVGAAFSYHNMNVEKAIDRMKSEFIAVASHELRTPMTSIKGSIDLILSGYAGDIQPDTQELLEIAQKNCDRLIRLINDILDLAKIEAGQIKLKLMPIRVSESAERALRGVKSLADQHHVRLRLDVPENLPLIEADRDRIEQVVTNLLSNAIKFSPAEGEVTVQIVAETEWVECAVCDQGCGIAEADLPKVFGKFQQVGDSQVKGGTGLGLAIAQALVNEHRGRMWVESTVNVGSRFIFRLPVLRTEAKAGN